ncbi:RagB/SusD family nutrient uptake outer membrane protein [Chitinophaga sedimenti]|uniref:RagB/SusD family nutrient uptake outer membrane protein n=1 Tax=Chitinophaga sedimenti TaxID=2033606 RepID=UPI00200439CD|nr:RagB/SusD family nutrient uptake outer membrane protein [Chitinophaga sedimenti]MCK7556293.1 RagB/SusD family nutrient uptake outer membrane protein [Chitinophaga sedimenti]
MKLNKYNITALLLGFLALTGCDKYLDVTPKGKRLLSTVADYDQWLNDEALIYGPGIPYGTLNFLGDNVDVPNITNPPTLAAELVYTWGEQFSTDINVAPYFWGEHYSRINKYNTLLIGIDKAVAGTLSQKRSLRAEALLGRAWEYFYLVNEYGKAFDSTTAAKDPGVPFVTSNDVSQVVPDRSTVAEIYKHIIDDTNAAVDDLPEDNSANRFRGSKASAYSLLARVFFYARNYTEAKKYAEMALTSTKAIMLDYNGANPASNFLSIRQDVIYGKMIIGNNTVTLDYMRTFAKTDLRVRKFYYNTDGYNFTTRGATLYFPAQMTPVFTYENAGTSVQEMKLIIAESAARANDLTVALQQLDEVRKNRFPTASYVRFESTDKEAVIQEILMERYHEMGFNCTRWFEMRRLDKEGRMPAVTRYNAQGTAISTLEPHSNRYTLQIPVQAIAFNPGMQQNP